MEYLIISALLDKILNTYSYLALADMYKALDIFFLILHSSLIVFNVFGWLWKKTRRANLILLLTTAGSWLILGLIVGSLGYCPLTDWHFNVLKELGASDLPVSYIKYLADRIFNGDFSSSLVDALTLYGLIAALAISLTLNILDFRRKKNHSRPY